MSNAQKKEGSHQSGYKIIGKPLARHDAWDKVFGKTVYADDFVLPGMLFAKVKRSEYAAANILSIDTSEAKNLPGVKAVMTAKDVPNNETITRFGQTHSVGGFEGLYRVLADKKVRFMGEAVAIVAADTERIAKEAVKLIISAESLFAATSKEVFVRVLGSKKRLTTVFPLKVGTFFISLFNSHF